MKRYMSETELAASLRRKFSDYSDFTIVQEAPVRLKDKVMRLDIVIKYGGKPVACVEVKTNENQNNLKNHLKAILKYSEIRFCFAIVNDTFKYIEQSSYELIDINEDEILRKLLESVDDNAEICNDLKNPFLEQIKSKRQWGKYGEILKEFINKGNLKVCGCNVFFEKDNEKEFFRKLLLTKTNDKMPEELCRYTSAKSFYLCLQDNFRISSVEVMNDEFETKVIDRYSHLQTVQTELSDYLYNGFILSFSQIGRKDKLLQWYMYGNHAKGVCFTVEPKNDKDVFWAPVIYIPQKQEVNKFTILDFLNELIGTEMEGKYRFKLRFWHYWKFFFKYDFYKEEEEVRLLIIQKDKGCTDWSDKYDMPYHYISKNRDDMPFKIKGVMFGPRYHNDDNLHSYISDVLGNSIVISHSEIIGYR